MEIPSTEKGGCVVALRGFQHVYERKVIPRERVSETDCHDIIAEESQRREWLERVRRMRG